MGKKFIVYLLAISMFVGNADYTVLAAEEVEEIVSNLAEDTDTAEKAVETETNVEEESVENFSSDVETEVQNLEEVQESEVSKKCSETEIQESENIDEKNSVTTESEDAEDETRKKTEESLTEYDTTLETEEVTIIQVEMQGVYEYGDSPIDYQKQYGDSVVYSMRSNNVVEYAYQEIMKSYEAGESGAEITVSEYGFSVEDIIRLVGGLKNDHPELYFVNKSFYCTWSGMDVASFVVTYNTSLSSNKFKQSTEDALSVIKPGMSDLEKAIALHDYLTVNCEYDKDRLDDKTIPYISYTAYGVLVEHIAVCQGYALAYKYLLNQAGIDCYMVESDFMNHAWNLIVLDGEFYQVDVTWDDPIRDLVGRARHTYMFRSDSAFENANPSHSNWNVTSGMDIVDYKATSTRYDSAFWADCNSPLVITENDCYYVSYSDKAIKKECFENIGGTGTKVCDIGVWPVWENNNSFWNATFSGLFQVNDRLYYNDKSSIYSVDFDGSNKKTEFTADTSTGYIYGSALRQGKVYYCLRQKPSITANETVLTADICFNTKKYTITFDADNGFVDISHKTVLPNKACGTLPIPKRDGYNFAGWYTERNGAGERITAETIITQSMTAYAKWEKPVIMYTVTYNMQGHGEEVSSETVEEGSLLTEPPAPMAKDYTFEGWYKDASCQNKWDFESDRVSSNMILYAKWLSNVSKDFIAEGKIDENYGNIVWSIDKNGKLLVTGRGDYYSVGNDNPTEPPWFEYKDKIKTAKIALSGSKSVYAMFRDCISLTEVDMSELNTDSVKNMDFMFDGCSSLTAVDLGHFNTGNVNTMVAMFQGCSSLKTLDLSNFDTSSLVDMEAMFLGCNNLSKLDVSHLNTGNVRSMGSVFAYCSKLTNVDLRSFDTKNVTRMCSMFSGCNNLAALDLSHFNTDRVREMSYMFGECRSLKTLDISNFNTRNVKEEDGCNDLLSGCVSLSYIHAPKNCTYSVELPIDVSTDKWYLNENTECTELPKNLGHSVKLYKNSYLGSSEDSVVVKFDLQNHGEEIDELIIEKGQKIQKPTEPVAEGYVFGGWYKESRCQNAWDFDKDVVTEDTTLYAKWVENAALVVTYNVTYNMQGYGQQIESEMVEEGSLLSEPASPTAEDYTFEGWYKDANCQNKWDFESDRVSSNMTLYAKWIPDVSKDVIAEGKIDENYGNIVWSIDKNGKLLVTGRGDYYSVGNGNPTEPPWMKYKSKIKTAKIALSGSKSVYAMFRDCINLTEVDLSDLDTSSVENMYYMFDGCRSLTEVDLSNLKTDNVYTMMAMFQGCRNLKTLDLSNFNTRNLVDMEAMFLGCSNLSKLDVSNFKTGNVYAMGSAFAVCEKLTNLDLSSFDTRNVTRMCAMFSGCSNLRALDLSHFNTDKVEDMCYMFEGCGRLETLDISNFNTANVSEEDGCTDLLSGCISLSYIHAPKNCTYSVKLPTAAATDKWYLEKNTECTELPKNLGYSAKLYKNLYIGSNEDSVTVKFDLQNHGEEIDDLIIEKGQKIQKPTEPVAEGYTFGGWFKELECQTAWDFDKDIVTEDTTLYAKWSYLGDTSAGDIPESGAPEGLWIAGIQDYTYTGKAIKPQIRVYFKEIKLKEGQDYTISYKNNIKAAGMDDKKAPTVTIKGKGNYAGTAVKTFTINKAMLTASNLKAASAYQMGKAYTPIIILNGNVLKNKTDYTLTYKTADGTVLNGQPTKELGSYIMHIKGKGNCGGSFDFHYKITEKGSVSIEKGTATVGEMIYGGKNPSTMLSVNGTILTASDYTVVFSNTNAKGTATATFIGIGKYTGVLKKTFKVVAQPLNGNNITIAKSVPYEKGGVRPAVTVKANKIKLFEGIDYIVSYKDNTKLGNTAKAIIKGKGNYSGSISVDFQIKGKALNDRNMKILVSDAVTGKKPAVTIYDINGKKLSPTSDYEANFDQAKHIVTITGGKNGCYTGTVTKTYKELSADKIITSVKLNKKASGFPKNYNAYTGKAVTLKNEWLTVKAKNVVLPSDCYMLSYVNNVEKGTATVIVQGKNGYSGTKGMAFKIKASGLGSILTWFHPNPDETDNRTFTVRFLANGGSWGDKEEMTVTVKSGSTAVLSEKPTREGYVFSGWKDSDGNAFYENTAVIKDMTVYAQWEVIKPTHTYADPFELPKLTGDKRKDFIAVAMSQLDYTEAEDGSTCFGAWAGDPYCNWCSEFAAWCAEQAGIPKTVIPKGTSSRKYRNFFAEKGRYYYIAEGIDGKNTEFMSGYKNIGTISAEDLIEGDIILKESDGDINNGPDHTAIFLKYEDGIVEYVSGNANDSVMVSHCYIEEFHGVCKPDF